MSNANDLDAQTYNQDSITAGSLAQCSTHAVGATINVGQGQHLFLDINCEDGAVVINLPAQSSAVGSGVAVDARVIADNDPGWTLVVNAANNGLTSMYMNNEEVGGGFTAQRVAVAASTITYSREGAGANNGLLQIRSCGRNGYSVLMNCGNMEQA